MSNNKPLPIIKTPEFKLKLPITKQEIIYRPYNVKDEKILLAAATSKSDDAEFYIQNTLNVLRGLIKNDVNLDTLPSAEVELFLLHVRAKSVGETIDFSFKDENDKKQNVSVNISEFTIKEVPEEEYIIEVSDGVFLEMKDLIFADKVKYGQVFKDDPTNAIFQTITDCTKKIYTADGETWIVGDDITKEEAGEFIENLTGSSQKLYKFVNNMPRVAVDIVLEDGTKRTFDSSQIDFLS